MRLLVMIGLLLTMGLSFADETAKTKKKDEAKKRPLIDIVEEESNKAQKNFQKAIKPLRDGVNQAVDDTVDAVDRNLKSEKKK